MFAVWNSKPNFLQANIKGKYIAKITHKNKSTNGTNTQISSSARYKT